MTAFSNVGHPIRFSEQTRVMLDRVFFSILVLCGPWTGLDSIDLMSSIANTVSFPQVSHLSHRENIDAAMERRSFASTLPYPVSIVETQPEHPPLLPWILLTSGAIVGIGMGAYVLKRNGISQDHRVPSSSPNNPTVSRLSSNPQRLKATTSQSLPSSLMASHRPSTRRANSSPSALSSQKSVMLKQHSVPLSKQKPVESLIEKLQSHDRHIKQQAIWELGQKGASIAIQPLVNSMVNADSQHRSLILAALSEIGARTLTPLNQALLISLQDKNADVRKNAIRDITHIYMAMDHISHILSQAIADEDPDVRATAQWALTQIRMSPTPTIPVLSTSPINHPLLTDKMNGR